MVGLFWMQDDAVLHETAPTSGLENPQVRCASSFMMHNTKLDYRPGCIRLQERQKDAARSDDQRHPSLPKDLPPTIECYAAFTDFLEIHNDSVVRTIYSMRKVADPPINPETQMISFRFLYRLDCGGNPAKAFTLHDAIVDNHSKFMEILPQARQYWEKGSFDRKRERALCEIFGRPFEGFLFVSYSFDFDDCVSWSTFPLQWPTPKEAEWNSVADWKNPVPTLSCWLWHGWVTSPDELPIPEKKVREMVKERKVWKWRPFSPAEVKELARIPYFPQPTP